MDQVGDSVVEDYLFDIHEEQPDRRVFVLIIYDIVENKRRVKLAKYLQGYGFRIQKSAFEALLKESVYKKMLSGLEQYASKEDSIRVYKLIGKGQVTQFGAIQDPAQEEVIII